MLKDKHLSIGLEMSDVTTRGRRNHGKGNSGARKFTIIVINSARERRVQAGANWCT